MTLEIGIVLGILVAALVLFVTELLRVDLVALLVLVVLAIAGLLTDPEKLVTSGEALSGFSNPAVITVWAVFVLSGGLSRTGVSGRIGKHVLRIAGDGETRLIIVLMLTTGVLSAFMNNVGVAAMLLPVVMDIAKRTNRAPSKLLIPLAYGSLLGGLCTLIGTPPNILASAALESADVEQFGDLEPFGMFEFALIGVPLLIAGVVYMAYFGKRLLPERDTAQSATTARPDDVTELFDLKERLFVVHVPKRSKLDGLPLAEARLSTALGLNVIARERGGRVMRAPEHFRRFQTDDRYLVAGRREWLERLRAWEHTRRAGAHPTVESLISDEVALGEVTIEPEGRLVGSTLRRAKFRQRFGANVLAIRLSDTLIRTDLQDISFTSETKLLLQAPLAGLDGLEADADIATVEALSAKQAETRYHVGARLLGLRLPEDSVLTGVTLAESNLSSGFDLVVLSIRRGDTVLQMPGRDTPLEGDDTLIVQGREEMFSLLLALQGLRIEDEIPPELEVVESPRVGLSEVILSPHTRLAGRTLRELTFRERYGLTALALWHEGKARRSRLADVPIRSGDALVVYGPREKLALLGAEPDYIVLRGEAQQAPRSERATLAMLIMAAVLLPVLFGLLPIAVAAVGGAALMVLTGCLKMDEAYGYIEWKAVFLIAGMLPLGIAMENSGAAAWIAHGVMSVLEPIGWVAVISGLFLVTNISTQIMPNPAVAVLMAPIALSASKDLGMNPYALMMTVAVAASAAVMSPVGHPANVLVMGPGGYRFADYLRVGLPLTIVLLIVVLIFLPMAWPLYAC